MNVKQCQHCGTRYRQGQGDGDFCCAGCHQVYQLIQSGGFEEYYRQQDRVGRPVGTRALHNPDLVSIQQLQSAAEAAAAPDGEAVLRIQGMSCMGCAWLIEQLCQRHRGLVLARVALDASLLRLRWQLSGSFDLTELAEELHQFGYRIMGDAATAGPRVSPLALRMVLSLVFSFNGWLLVLAAGAGLGGVAVGPLYDILIVVCLFFSCFIGGSVFFKPAWGAAQLSRWHSDAGPALLLIASLLAALISLLFTGFGPLWAALYFSLLPALVFARWVTQNLALKSSRD